MKLFVCFVKSFLRICNDKVDFYFGIDIIFVQNFPLESVMVLWVAIFP